MPDAILINPIDRALTLVQVEDSYISILNHLGASDFSVLNVRNLPETDLLLASGEEPTHIQHMFAIQGLPGPVPGKAILVGAAADGSRIDTTVTIEQLEDMIQFVSFCRPRKL